MGVFGGTESSGSVEKAMPSAWTLHYWVIFQWIKDSSDDGIKVANF